MRLCQALPRVLTRFVGRCVAQSGGRGADVGAVEAEGADTAPALSLMVVDRLGKEL